MNHKTKLELTWIGKENRPKLEPRILVEDREKSHHDPFHVGGNDLFVERLIVGDSPPTLSVRDWERERS